MRSNQLNSFAHNLRGLRQLGNGQQIKGRKMWKDDVKWYENGPNVCLLRA